VRLVVARGDREPPLAARAPDEFQPVFSAFRRMAADLGESRAALESAQRRTAATLRNVASGVVALDSDDVITLANPRAEAMLDRALPAGLTAEQLGEETARRLRAFAEGEQEEEEFELTIHGRQLQARLTRLSAGRGGTVLTLDDITELARAQRVLAWGEMARQVAHEIKNPLTPIRLGVQHLKRAHADKRADFDAILETNAERILAEIDRLDEIARGFSRYGMGPSALQTAEPINVSAIVRDVVELEKLGEGSVDWRAAGIAAAVEYLAELGRRHDPAAQDRRSALTAAYRVTREHEMALFAELMEGLLAIPDLRVFGIRDFKRFNERCSTVSVRLEGHTPTEVATFLGDRGIFTWDGNFYALNLTERLGVQTSGGLLRIGLVHYNTADEVERLLTALREFSGH